MEERRAASRRPLLAAMALAVAGVVGVWSASRGSASAEEVRAFAAEVGRLRAEAGARTARMDRLESEQPPPAPPIVEAPRPAHSEVLPGEVPVERSERLDRLERSVAALARQVEGPSGPAPPDAAERGRRILERLAAVADVRQDPGSAKDFRELVRLGDPVVPGIVAFLDSGAERQYAGRDSHGMSAGRMSHTSLRTTLLDALAQIGSPAAKRAMLDCVSRSGIPGDLRTLLSFYEEDADSEWVRRVSALVLAALRKVAESGAEEADDETSMLSDKLLDWVRTHGMTEAAGALATIVGKARLGPNGWTGPEHEYFRVLLVLDPTAAAEAVLALQRVSASEPLHRQAAVCFATGIETAPGSLACKARYLDRLIASGSLGLDVRRYLYGVAPDQRWPEFEDPERRQEDGRVMVAFLEVRLSTEVDEEARSVLEAKLTRLREAIEDLTGK